MVAVDPVWTGLPGAIASAISAMIVLSVVAANDAVICYFQSRIEPTLPWEDHMPTSLNRLAFGFLAAVISVLTFHQGMWALLHLFGLMPPAYPMRGVPHLECP